MHSKTIEQSFAVQYAYKLHFTQKLFDVHNTLFKDVFDGYKKNGRVKAFFVIDKGVHEHHPGLDREIKDYCVQYSANVQYTGSLIIKGGEQCKNDYGNVSAILEKINTNSICRHSFVVAIGGGAIIDMVGYAAAIAHRGVKLIRVPTTVLSQNDSAVGVKNSINSFDKKNFLGTFAPPYAIINDTDFLKTLEQRDWIAGIAEALKVALIKDKKFFNYLEDNAEKLRNRDMTAMQYVIYKCAEMHMHHIAQGGDPFESGSSRPLDFGHWAAHKLEQMSQYTLRHGEAVAKGIALDITYSQLMGLISEDTQKRILNVMQKIGLDLHIPVETEKEIQELLQGIEEFREHLGGELCITLISEIGKKHDVNKIDLDLMQHAIKVLNDGCKIKID
ncbi:3-dehydroquinate synthase [Ulvibacterium marinum]|uniref:3-dehydroquinate synthase n=1 Tax=Ulvibacterium marinum TaxID=2419782 RepID=A0A3B0C6I9_9FLAO|nr:3-dehydroquinate synthase [Ulvibacterium marinum]RKN81783.1 3-dehydroquinate synthase [Ulvibacterium marinum]